SSCPYIGLRLGRQELVEATLIRRPGAEQLDWLDDFITKNRPMLPKLNRRRAQFVLTKINEILAWEQRKEVEKDTRFVELGRYLCEVRAGRDGQEFDCATWLHRARVLPKEQFRREVEKELTGKETEPWEIIYFKLYKSQIPVIEQALETAALMLGSDRAMILSLTGIRSKI